MAGGKLTPRQKMINLMYLVFIAMMALNMSKEVLTAFGLMNEKFEASNQTAQLVNESLLNAMASRAEDDPTRYLADYEKAQQISKISNDFYNYIGTLKTSLTEKVVLDEKTGKMPYEQMDKGEAIDYGWFAGEGYSDKGNEIIKKFAQYREDVKKILGNDVSYQFLVQNLDAKFETKDVTDSQGITKPYLDYHYKGYPSIASLTKLSALQNDVREIEAEAFNMFLGNTLKQAASMKNYQAFVITDKSVYFAGEPIKGKVVLGRFDKSTVPTAVTVNGRAIDPKNMVDGQVVLNMTAGNVGEHKFNGKFTFMEDGQPVVVDVQNSNYVVVPRPNSATIAADKMNVVYIGLDNPISVSFAGVSNDKVNVTSSIGGLRKVGEGKYVLKPTAGREVTITASGTLPDGKVVSDKQLFRVKPIPAGRGTIRGEYAAKGPVENMLKSTISARMEDFDFEVNISVTECIVVFPRIGSTKLSGGRWNDEAIRMAERLKPGDVVRITGIKTKLTGADIPMKTASDATYTIQ
ncbi:gliding motility protein GldM [Paenimyroides tangerinum]|uniref:Gliding motility protein GldM n=1 Tax=Paenimyroides tangerinum TaxID=2488728 RepID=A0A3P3WGI0_9FLAO|nr:gliding motility protein GldM [Paenimyroides tangerinum]RRJ93126.1 gliding motility protein GldM [Paenimyroides tangerinum]